MVFSRRNNFFLKSQKDSGNKYGNQKVEYDGMTFDSKIELKRYMFLKDAERKGIISNLKCHPSYELIPRQSRKKIVHLKTKDKEIDEFLFHPITFAPDFVYEHNGEIKSEDVKGSKHLISPDFPLRQKLLYYIHGIYVRVVTRPTENIE